MIDLLMVNWFLVDLDVVDWLVYGRLVDRLIGIRLIDWSLGWLIGLLLVG